MKKIYPAKLKVGDEVRVIAPSRSLAIISQEARSIAQQRFADLELRLSFGSQVEKRDLFSSASIASRLADLHDAFRDPNIKAILTAIGGFNSNQLLQYIDWELIESNPKIFCGYSDITALSNAMLAKTGLVSYSGPHYSTFGQKLYFDYTLDYFKKCLWSDNPFTITPSSQWSDDAWYQNQDDRNPVHNDGWVAITEGKATGTVVGANLCTLNLLQGTEYFPSLNDTILFVEGDDESLPHTFDRDLQSLIQLPDFHGVRGVVIGRFQRASQMSAEKLEHIIKSKKELTRIPVIANVDFGHTDPKITFPIGGVASMAAADGAMQLQIVEH